ncbi:hypothetical protein SAMD00019534_074290 [Acytostelium subglobosum LB1]|uniref:hypothetical protein n=1 Tax=Acytostelium subglobosum LB1 TaxID=1410327 RepID=UPI0006450437|nr:hypothetical protein SAMD00019534_074290 [Acytostelium subglobosum LB1]GAM24254.1 hypothetical protein SAMD00019534_074290 [Acytostelium subglobosum LB1]|eukprot:XP_012752580.1 hypothetical protein SAMD00019534_074290 [Acytostelium subglobosum LB1]
MNNNNNNIKSYYSVGVSSPIPQHLQQEQMHNSSPMLSSPLIQQQQAQHAMSSSPYMNGNVLQQQQVQQQAQQQQQQVQQVQQVQQQLYEFNNVKDFRIMLNKYIETTSMHHDWPVFLSKIYGQDPKGIIRICTEEEIPALLSQLSTQSECFRFLLTHFSNNQNLYLFPMDRVPPLPQLSAMLCDVDKNNKRSITINIFQLYFFAFGLFGDYWSQNPSIRSVLGVPTYSYTGRPVSPTSRRSPERQKAIYARLLNDYLHHFLPLDPKHIKQHFNQSQTLSFLSIISECYLGHNLTNLTISKITPEFQPLFTSYKRPSVFYTDMSYILLTHFQEFTRCQPQLMFVSQLADSLRYPLFNCLVSFFERFDPNDSELPLEQTIRLWMTYLTPWRSSRAKRPKTTSMLLLSSNDPGEPISEQYITDNYYFYSYIFSFFIVRSLLSFDFSLDTHFKTFLKVMDVILHPETLACLHHINKHDCYLMSGGNSNNKQSGSGDALSNEVLHNLELQLIAFGIKENQERSMFSDQMSNNVQCLLRDLLKKPINPKTKEIIASKLMTLYEDITVSDVLEANMDSSSSRRIPFTIGSSSVQNSGGLRERQDQILASLSPNRSENGSLTSVGRRQIYDGTRSCTVYDTYKYPLDYERFPLTSNEIAVPIKLVYRLTDKSSTRLMARRVFRKDRMLWLSIFLAVLWLAITVIIWINK